MARKVVPALAAARSPMIDCPDSFKGPPPELLSARRRAAISISGHRKTGSPPPSPCCQGYSVDVFGHAGPGIRDVHLKLQPHIFSPTCRQGTGGDGNIPVVRFVADRSAAAVVLRDGEVVVVLEMIFRAAVEVERNVIPGIGLETGAGNAGMQPFMVPRVPHIPNAGGIVALRPEHEFRPGGELGDLLVELEDIELQRLRILGIAVYVEPKVHLEVGYAVISANLVPPQPIRVSAAADVEIATRAVHRRSGDEGRTGDSGSPGRVAARARNTRPPSDTAVGAIVDNHGVFKF